MDDELLREAIAAAEGHLRLAERIARPALTAITRAAAAGSTVTRAELAHARRLAGELAEAQARAERLRAAVRQHPG